MLYHKNLVVGVWIARIIQRGGFEQSHGNRAVRFAPRTDSLARLIAQSGDDARESHRIQVNPICRVERAALHFFVEVAHVQMKRTCRRAKGWLMLQTVFDVSFCFFQSQLA